MSETISADHIATALNELAGSIEAKCGGSEFFLVGIANGGVILTQLLASRISAKPQWGILNALFHRDDVGLKPIPNNFQPTQIDFSVEGANVVLVDDVFSTGRTIRAALSELFDHGRPSQVYLAVLVDVDRARLPIRPDFVGLKVEHRDGEKVEVSLDLNQPDRNRISIVEK